jgi:RHS repeat-associated protein
MTYENGNVLSETRYTAWGEVRYSSGTMPTKYSYTGQYSYTADFGLMFYNACWYDSSLGRFAQADTIVPGGVQGLDRYAYVNNNPVKHTDPSGHCYADSGAWIPDGLGDACLFNTSNQATDSTQQLSDFGITTNGNDAQNQTAVHAAQLVGRKIATTVGNYASPYDTFIGAHGNINITFDGRKTKDCETKGSDITCGSVNESWFVQAMIHEFGHVFDNHFQIISGTGHLASDYPDNSWNLTYEGYKGTSYPNMQHPSKDDDYGERGSIEDFADMYLNWVLDMDIAYPHNGFTNEGMGNDRRDMMNNVLVNPKLPRGMPVWLGLMGLK